MSLTTKTLADYLGGPVSVLLADAPFKHWTFQKSFENDLEEPLIDYVFAQNGMDLVCDGEDTVTIIFLYSDESRCFKEGLQDIPFSSTRQKIVDRLGPPSKSGGGMRDPILGDFGPWDRFAQQSYSIHIEYRMDADHIKMITLTRADVVP
jgi:hypothetical protein